MTDQRHRAAVDEMVSGASLSEVLTALVLGVEAEHSGVLGCVMLLNEPGTHLTVGAAPSLPASFSEAMDGAALSPPVSCGVGALGDRVVVPDVRTAPRWTDDVAIAAAGAAAFLSEPIRGDDARVLGVFTLYSAAAGAPDEARLDSLLTAARLAAVAIDRARSEEALRVSNQLLEASQAIARVGGWELDVVSQQLYWTAETYRIHDTSPEEFNPTVDAGVGYFLPESRRLISEALQAAMERGEGYDLELETLTTKGRLIHVRTTCVVTLREGRPVKLTGIFQDISEQKAAEAVLVKSRRQLATAMSLTRLADWEMDLQRGVLVFNDRIYALFGTTAAQEGGYEMSTAVFLRELCHPDDAGFVAEHIAAASSVPLLDTRQLEFRLRRRDGAVRYMVLHFQIKLDAAERAVWGVGSILDITERRQAELAREVSESQLKAVIDSAMDAVIILNSDQQIVLFNAAAERMFGRTAGEMVGQPMDRLIPSRFRTRHQRQITTFSNLTGASRQMAAGRDALVGLRADGEEFPIEVSISKTFAAEQPLFIAIARDIAARKTAEREREALQAQLQQAQRLESIGQLAGGVAHDFNNMLSVIMMSVAMALEDLSPDEELHANLLEIRTAAERSAGLTRQLLEFARQQAIDPRVLALNETVEGMLSMLRRLLGEDLHMTWAPGTNLWHVKVDPGQVDQLLANLCINARHAITGVGNVTIATANVVLDGVLIQGEAAPVSGEYVRLTVSDTGCGMDAATLARIFEPFFTTKELGQGTGLGLSTVYGIVKQNDGTIDVESEPGEGTTFAIYLPRQDVTPAREARVEQSVTHGGETLLVVDDEPAVLLSCARVLRRMGYTVLAAASPAEALRIAEAHTHELSLLVTDVIMPEMSGKELSERLLARFPDLKCLFVSGYTADIIATRGVLEDGRAFLQKPFLPEDLALKVRSVLDGPLGERP